MALDKLVDSTQLDACCTAEANAIRAKTGGSSQIAYDWANSKGFADAIASIPTGGGGTTLQTTTVTLTQDYAQSGTVGTTLKNLFDAAIGTDFWVAEVSEFPSGKSESDLASVVIRAFKFTSLNAANMQGYDTDVMSSSTTSPGNAAFFRSNTAQYCQGSYPGSTNAKAWSGMKFTIWGWNAS